jgi:hypothetical protein
MQRLGMVAAFVLSAFAGSAQAQQVTSFADVAGSWHGFARYTQTETALRIRPNGSWTLSALGLGKESGTGAIEDGHFKITLKEGRGEIKVRKTSADAIATDVRLYDGRKWLQGQINGTRCAEPDCTDRATEKGKDLLQ